MPPLIYAQLALALLGCMRISRIDFRCQSDVARWPWPMASPPTRAAAATISLIHADAEIDYTITFRNNALTYRRLNSPPGMAPGDSPARFAGVGPGQFAPNAAGHVLFSSATPALSPMMMRWLLMARFRRRFRMMLR